MGYAVTYSDLLNFKWALEGASGQLFEALSNIGKSFREFMDMESFQGATAENMKSYISEVSGTISAGFQVALQELNDKYLFYKDGYGPIDSSVQFVLTEDKFIELLNFYRGSEGVFETESLKANQILNEVSDISYFTNPRPYNVFNAYQHTGQSVNELMVTVGDYETTQSETALSLFMDIIGPLKGLISEYAGKSGNSSLSYQHGDVGKSQYLQSLGEALQTSVDNHEANADELAAIRDREEARFKELEEIWAKERAEQGLLNFLVGALVVVGGIACIVATAGMATPFVVAGAIAATGTIAYGVSNMVEAGQHMYYGLNGDYSTVAFNPLRDTIFQGNQKAWDTFGTVCQVACAVVTFGGSAYGNAAAAAGQAAKAGACSYGQFLAAAKGVSEVVVKGGITMIAAAGGGYVGSELGKGIAEYLGASDTVQEIAGLVGGTIGAAAAGTAAGKAVSKWEWHYEPGNGLPSNVCFIAGTLVVSASGLVAIEKVRAGDRVISTNPETGETDHKKVVETYIREVTQLTKITVGGEDIIATPNHPFYCTDKGWIAAVDVKAGYMLRCPGGELVSVEGVMHTNFDEPVKVYNFQVEDFHTYYVGRVGVLVHNTCEYTMDNGEITITDWGDYPEGLPKPEGPLKIVEGDEYANALKLKNATNQAIHNADPSLDGMHIHEIQPVKFGGSPTDMSNKIALSPTEHNVVSGWWRSLQHQVTR